MTQTDVLIIGGGPAGSASGSYLARKGRSVVCVEAGTFPRFQIGESLLPRCNDLLEEAGLFDAVVARKYIVKEAALFLRDKARERFAFADVFPGQRTQTYQVPRADFDQTLATAARQNGLDLRYQTRVDSVELSADGVMGFVTDTETEQRSRISAKYLIDCSGYGRVLPKLLKLEKDAKLDPRVAVFTHVEGDLRPEGGAEGDIWVCVHPKNAWMWIIPFSNGRTSVGIVAKKEVFDEAPGATDREKLFALIAQDPNAGPRLAKAVPVMKTERREGWSSSVERLYGPRWALAGNASEFLDPVFSSGVMLALESGLCAAKCVERELSGEKVDWETDFAAVVRKAVSVFRVFVSTWYDSELPELLLTPPRSRTIKQAITAILGGYVLDDKNRFVRDAEGTLRSLFGLMKF
ncbi:MAG: NAD(P)/FAD-dependent oxidoreductase [Myxococcaceae bacterium]